MFSGLPPKADLPAEHSGQTFYNEAFFQLHEADAGLRRQAATAKCKAMGRPDPYQERAREMTREAGLDPDGRIERLGQRSMPVWCTFRDAARKEHLAQEAADAATTIAAEKPQAPQFQNSPLKVFGEHDHATVAQMRNCTTVHGAGRLFGRKEAKRRFTREQMNRWLQDRGVTLIGADLDESPMAYRRLPEVIAQHAGTVKVLHTLRPSAVVMAGTRELDPWKD